MPFNVLSDDWPLLGGSRHSSKEFICSVRPSLNDRFRLGADGQIIELRQAENDPFPSFEAQMLQCPLRETCRTNDRKVIHLQSRAWLVVVK